MPTLGGIHCILIASYKYLYSIENKDIGTYSVTLCLEYYMNFPPCKNKITPIIVIIFYSFVNSS
jgi:hypothetical protein